MKHRYEQYWDYQEYRIIECLNCGFKHIDPIPVINQLDEYYKQAYHNQIKPSYYHKISNAMIETYTRQIDETPQFIKIYTKATEFLERNSSLKMIDIGCGNGLLGKYFQNRGWTAYGLEPGRDAAAYLRRFGLQVFENFVEEIDSLGLMGFSFANLQFVLEHISNPLEVLQKLYNIIEPGGIIRICVPNDFSEGQLAYAEYYKAELKWVCLPDHINYFNFDSLNGLLNKSGFQEVYRTTNFPLELLLLGGINYYADEEARKKVSPFVENFENALTTTGRKNVLDRFYETLSRQGLGRSVIIYAKKYCIQ